MRVLFVDDDSSVLKQAEIFLEKEVERLSIETTISAEEGLELLEEKDFDVIISDYQMPGMDGLEFLRIVREERDSDIPFIVFTGKGREEVAMDALNLGANRYLHKRGSPKSQYGVLADAIVQEYERWSFEERMEKTLKKRAEVEHRISEITLRYVADYDFDEITNETLADVGRLVGASKAYLFLFREDGKKMDNTHEWFDEGVTSRIDDLQGLSTDRFSWAIEKLNKGEIIHINDVANMPEEAESEKEMFESQNIKSVLALPVYENDELAGFIGFDNVEKIKEWDDEAIFTLRIISTVVGYSLEKKRGRKALRESKKKYRILSEGSSDGIYLFQNGEYKYVNEGMVELSGYSREELKNMGPLDLIHPDYREDIARWTAQALDGDTSGLPEEHEFKAVRKDGESVWVQVNPILVEYEGEHAIIGNVTDITERKKMEKELRKSERKFRRAFEASPDPVFLLDEDGVFVDVNETALQILGFEKGEIVGSSLWNVPFFPDETVEKTTEKFERRKEGEEIPTYSVELETRDGERIITEVNVRKFEEDGFAGEIVVARDITERKKAEERFRKYVENSPYGVIVVDREGNYQEVNEAACEITGYSEGELLDMDFLDLHDPEGQEYGREEFESLKEEGEMRSELPFRRKDGSGGYMDVYAISLSEDRNLAFIEDVTERIEAEEELEEAREYYRAIVETSPEVIVISDLEGEIIDCNQKLVDIGAFDSKDEVIGKNAFDFIAPEDRERAEEYLEKTLEKGEIRNIEYTLLNSDGNEYPAELSASIIYDSEGSPVSLMAIIRDITKRKEVEEREEFLHSLLRHDLKNKANVVSGYLEKIKDFDFPEEADTYLDEALETTISARELIEKVRNLRKLRDGEMGSIEIGQTLDQIFQKFEKKASEKGIELELDKEECKVRVGPLVEELFSNLLENSIVHSGCDKIWITGESDEGEFVVSVIDDGEGIPDGKKEKIFERGFKEGEASGFGLGLYLVKKIVDNYGGEIEVKDSEDGGVRFDVRLRKSENLND